MTKEKVFISEADQYLFAQGTHYDIYKKLGAHLSGSRRRLALSRLQALERDRLNVQRELTLLRGELARLPLEQSKQISELRRSLSSTDQELVESELRRQVLVVAPRDGVATAVTAEASAVEVGAVKVPL
jgi:hypothetical protein